MPKSIKVKIVTPERVVLQEEYEEAIIPTTAGEIGVLANHTPLVSGIQPGEIRLKKGDHTTLLAISSGFIEVRPNSKIVILADTAERAEEIDLERAEKARTRAEAMLKEKSQAEDIDYARLQSQLDKELARLKVGRKYKKLPLR